MALEGATPPAGRAKKLLVGSLVALAALAIILAVVLTAISEGHRRGKDSAHKPILDPPSVADAPESSAPVETVPVPSKTLDTGTTTVTITTTTTTTTKTTPAPPPASAMSKVLQDLFSPTKSSAPLPATAALSAGKQVLDAAMGRSGEGCWVCTAEDLVSAVADAKCPTILLCSQGVFRLSSPLQVTRPLTIIGHPRTMPTIDGSEAIRAIHVREGGYLDMRFVRLKQGGGVRRDRLSLGGPGGIPSILRDGERRAQGSPSQITVIYGGTILFDAGAGGGNLRRVIFEAVGNTAASVVAAITNTVNFVGGRILGGHVAIVAGAVNFVGCVFWDTTILLPFTDQVTIGGDVLVLGGVVNMVGCFFFSTVLFAEYMGAGFTITVLGGTVILTGTIITAQGILISAAGAGFVFMIGGGVLVIAGMDFRYVAAGLTFEGMGTWFVAGGVMVLSGFTIENGYAVILALGIGFYAAVGSGVLVQNGVTFYQVNGPNFQTLTGGSFFQGSGNSYHTGIPASFYQTTGYSAGVGIHSYNGPGYAQYVAMPLASFAATLSFYGVGSVWAHMAGYLVFLANPFFGVVGVSYQAGDGAVLWAGPGAGTIGASPVYAPAGLTYSNANNVFNNFVINGATTTSDGIADWWVVRRGLADNNSNSIDGERCLADLEAGRLGRRSVWTLFNLTTVDVDENSVPNWCPRNMIPGLKKLLDVKRQVLARREQLTAEGRKGGLAEMSNVEGVKSGRNRRTHIRVKSPQNPQTSACLVLACGNGEPVSIDSDGPALIEAEDCADIRDKMDKVQQLDRERQATGEEGVVYDPTIIVPTTVNVEGVAKVSQDEVKQALLASTGQLELIADPAVSVQSSHSINQYRRLHIQRHLSAAADLLAHAAAAAPEGPSSNDARQQAFSAQIVLRNAVDGKAVREAIAQEGMTNDTLRRLAHGVQDYLRTLHGSKGIGDVSVEAGGPAVTVPAYGTRKFQDFVTRRLGGALQADVVIKDAGGGPVQIAQLGDVLTAHVSGFPKETRKVTLQLIGAAAAGGKEGQPASVPLAKGVALNAEGGVSHAFAIPSGIALGDYYLLVTDGANGAHTAMGEVFKVGNKPQTRRKLGPRAVYL